MHHIIILIVSYLFLSLFSIKVFGSCVPYLTKVALFFLSFFLSVQAEEDAEIEMGDNEMEDVLRHQLSHREVFLSRQYENINANTIR